MYLPPCPRTGVHYRVGNDIRRHAKRLQTRQDPSQMLWPELQRTYECLRTFSYGWRACGLGEHCKGIVAKVDSGIPTTNAVPCMDVLGLAHLADSFVLSKVRADIFRWYWRPTAYCLEWGFMLLAMEQHVLLPLFYSTSTPLGSHWTLLDAIMSRLIFSSYCAYLRCYAGCLGAACIWMWTAISIARMSTHWQAAAMRSVALFTLLAAAACRWQSDIVGKP